MEFERFIGGKFKTSTLPYMLSKRFHDLNFLLPGCDLGQVIIFGFNVVQP
jgi:hypothetical protein